MTCPSCRADHPGPVEVLPRVRQGRAGRPGSADGLHARAGSRVQRDDRIRDGGRRREDGAPRDAGPTGPTVDPVPGRHPPLGQRPSPAGTICARHSPRRPLPHRRAAGERRDGRGVSSRGPDARPARRDEVPSRSHGPRRGVADAIPERGARGAAGVASQRVPCLRHRRGRRPDIPHHGVHPGRGPRVAAPTHRPAGARQGRRDGARAVRGPGSGARQGRAAPRPEARQRDDRRARARAARGLRPRRRRGGVRGRARGHSGLHGAGVVRASAGDRAVRHLRARPRALRDVHRQAGVQREHHRRPRASAPRSDTDADHAAGLRDRSAGGSDHPALPREGSRRSPVLRAAGRRGDAGRRPAGGRAGRGRNAVAGDGGGFRWPRGVEGGARGGHPGRAGRGRAAGGVAERANAGRPLPAGDEATGRARRSGQDDGARPWLPRHGTRRGVGVHHHRLHAAPAERPVGGAMGEPASGSAARRGVLVPAVAGRARVRQPAAIRPGDLQHPLAVAAGDGQRPRRSQGAAAVPHGEPAADTRHRGARGIDRLEDRARCGRIRSVEADARRAVVDPARVHRRARGVGRRVPRSSGGEDPHRGRCRARTPGLLPDLRAVEPADAGAADAADAVAACPSGDRRRRDHFHWRRAAGEAKPPARSRRPRRCCARSR